MIKVNNKIKKALCVIIFIIYSVTLFSIGFNYGNIKLGQSNIENEIDATEKLLKAQGDNPESIKASLDLIRIARTNEAGNARRELLSIWVPSILIIVNIVLTIVLTIFIKKQ